MIVAMIAFVSCVGKSKSFIRGHCLQGGKLLPEREKGKGKMEKGKEKLIFYSQREIKHNSDTNVFFDLERVDNDLARLLLVAFRLPQLLQLGFL